MQLRLLHFSQHHVHSRASPRSTGCKVGKSEVHHKAPCTHSLTHVRSLIVCFWTLGGHEHKITQDQDQTPDPGSVKQQHYPPHLRVTFWTCFNGFFSHYLKQVYKSFWCIKTLYSNPLSSDRHPNTPSQPAVSQTVSIQQSRHSKLYQLKQQDCEW